MSEYDTVIVRYGEMGIKSDRTRKRFERILIKAIHAALKREKHAYNIRKERGRIFVDSPSANRLCLLLNKTFGIISLSPAVTLSSVELNEVVKKLVDHAKTTILPGQTFAVRARRAGVHPFTSKDVEIAAGEAILKAFDHEITVNLKNPENIIHAEIRENKAYIYHEIIGGLGGLPLNTQGKVVCMLSGGIDSPVASYLIMKRGSLPIYVYFHSHPYVDELPKRRVIDVANRLKEYASGYRVRLYIVPQGRILEAIIKGTPQKMLCILCRRSMYRLAEQIAKKERAEAIVTGESLGQKASQTLRNLFVETYGMEFPFFRPLIGLDKIEIEQIAKRISTYELSIRPTPYCTAVPKYPITSANLKDILEAEREVELGSLLNESIENAEIMEF